ncbi:hypothetical protein SteCoe_10498 [Stentor coeruleus]|uniref:Peptidase A1 domain-containing protein n=1 Tax=Stentor coeruleus TaxID=5963 RepID=A0A1R2CFF9_9CILI|nr:hypothetical protein SteCoe_10498 [Stentor coeruleus]
MLGFIAFWVVTAGMPIVLKGKSSFLTNNTDVSSTGPEEIQDVDSGYYVALVEIGEEEENFDLVLSLNSSWTTVPGAECDCHNVSNKLEPDNDEEKDISDGTFEVGYGKGYFSGSSVKDIMEIGDFVIRKQEFLLYTKDERLEDLAGDGVLALSPTQVSNCSTNFILNMHSQGLIPSPKFSLYLSQSSDSYLLFNESSWLIKDPNKNHTLSLKTLSSAWVFNASKISYDDYIKNITSQVFLMVELSSIQGPYEDISKFLKLISENKDCTNGKYLTCSCNENSINSFPNFTIEIQGHRFKITSKNYIQFSNSKCKVLFEGRQDEYWALGIPFFYEYYSVFDLDTKKVTFYRNSLEDDDQDNEDIKDPDGKAEDNSQGQGDEKKNMYWKYILMIIGICIIFAIIGCLIYVYFRKKKEQERDMDYIRMQR